MDATILIKPVLQPLRGLLLAAAVVMAALPALAQETLTPNASGEGRTLSMSQPSQDYAVLHVNSAAGSDQQGVGTAEQPYKTITQALLTAPTTSTVILLAPGHYSQESGESFPLRLRPGITIQGNSGETRNTIIMGGGELRGNDMGQTVAHNVTIVTSDRSGLANIAVSNPKGSGVWISGGSPILRRVALVSNTVAGVQVANGAPVIENSYFNLNQQGVSIRGTGRAVVRGNYFEETGRAITVASPATPAINNNRIARNDVGIALKNNARPVLEANVLDSNGRNGVVEVDVVETVVAAAPVPSAPAAPMPSASATVAAPFEVAPSPVAPSLRSDLLGAGNALLGLGASADEPSTVAVVGRGTALGAAPVPTVSGVETEADNEAAEEIEAVEEIEAAEEIEVVEEIEAVEEVPSSTLSSFRQHLAASSAATPVVAAERPALLQRRSSLPEPVDVVTAQPLADFEPTDSALAELPPVDLASDDAIDIAVIPLSGTETSSEVGAENIVPEAESSGDRPGGVSNLLARLRRRSGPVVPSPAPASSDREAHISPVASGQRLPVPSAAIPSTGGSAHLLPPGTVSLASSFRYRVLVDMVDADELQTLVPDAFRTRVGRDVFMQAGAYVDEEDAHERLAWLQENGIEGRINLRE